MAFVSDGHRAPSEVTREQPGEPGVRIRKPLFEPSSQSGVQRSGGHPIRPLKSPWRTTFDPEERDHLLVDLNGLCRVVLRGKCASQRSSCSA
jgi:hypothetical protein